MKSEQDLDRIRGYLENTLNYSAAEADRVMEHVEQMDDDTFQWLVTWRREGTYPNERVEDVTVKELVDNMGMEPVNAFLCIAWLKQEPEEAKYVLSRPWNVLEIPEEVRKQLLNQVHEGDE